jgi:hypothetical protein
LRLLHQPLLLVTEVIAEGVTEVIAEVMAEEVDI